MKRNARFHYLPPTPTAEQKYGLGSKKLCSWRDERKKKIVIRQRTIHLISSVFADLFGLLGERIKKKTLTACTQNVSIRNQNKNFVCGYTLYLLNRIHLLVE